MIKEDDTGGKYKCRAQMATEYLKRIVVALHKALSILLITKSVHIATRQVSLVVFYVAVT